MRAPAPQLILVLVTGGRRFGPSSYVWSLLDGVRRNYPGLCIVQGGAHGADAHARSWAKARGPPMPYHGRTMGCARLWGRPQA